MATVETVADQVAGILARNEIPFSEREDGLEYAVTRGSAVVFVTFRDASVPIVSMSSPVLQDIDLEENIAAALICVNQLNCDQLFAKFCIYPDGTLRLEHDLLGEELSAGDLVASLAHISKMADDLDDQLAEELGGVRFESALDAVQGAVQT